MISPSAQAAALAADAAETAGTSSDGGSSGRSHTFARSTVTRPVWLTTSPSSSRRITSTHSSRRATRSSFDGQRSPVIDSFMASPLASAVQNLPGNMVARVPIFCATTAGW